MANKEVPWKTPMIVLYCYVASFLFFFVIPEFYDVPWDIDFFHEQPTKTPHSLVRVDRHGTVLASLDTYPSYQICQRFAYDQTDHFWNRFEDQARQKKRALRAQIELLTEQIKTKDPNAELRQHQGLNEAQAEIDEIDLDLRYPGTWAPAKCVMVPED